MHKELVIPFSELRTVSIECGDCHAVLLVDVEAQLDVTRCAACNRQFDPAVKSGLARWRGLYDQMKETRNKFAFRIPATGLY